MSSRHSGPNEPLDTPRSTTERNSRHRPERLTYDRSERYNSLGPRRPTPRFGVRQHDIEGFIDAFVLEREAAGLSPETLRSYVADLGVFATWLQVEGYSHDPATWDIHLLRGYVSYLQRKPNKNAPGRIAPMTVRSYTSRLLAFLRWLHEEGYLPFDLAAKLKKPQAPTKVVQPLSPSDVRAMAEVAEADCRTGIRDHALFCIMIDTGLRASEICGLKPGDVLWDQRLLKVMGKWGRERVVPFSPATGQSIHRYLLSHTRHPERADTLFQTEEGWALTPHGLHHIVKKLAFRAGVADAHPHKLRHTFAIGFLRNGGNVLVLQRILGHTTLTMTNRYVALIADDLMADHDAHSPVTSMLGHQSANGAKQGKVL